MTLMILAALAVLLFFSIKASAPPFQGLHIGLHSWFFLFLGSSFLGCILEAVFVWMGTGIWMSRSSLLYGALSIVWGLGAVLMVWILSPLHRYGAWAVWAGGAVLGGGFEYLASLVLELTYHRLFWDYSHIPLNLDGRTNLWYAIFWGLAGLLWVYWLAPALLRLLNSIPVRVARPLAGVLAILLAVDILLSVAAFWRMNQRSLGQEPSYHWELLLDTWYSNQVMQHRYQNMTLPAPTSP